MDNDSDRNDLMKLFTTHLNAQAGRYLAAGQKLEVKFTDIDLAGAYEPWRGAQMSDIRFLKDIYPPRMKLEYRLLGAEGKVLKEGKAELSDLSYLSNLTLPGNDNFRYDKGLLNDWLRREFGKK